jgi:hypothetical protein
MRADMAKVIVERPRRGGQGSRKGRIRNFELLPTKEGMRRRWTDLKSLNENLAPLRRFLVSRVGRRWDAVYAELNEHLALRNAVQQHVRTHLSWFVALKLQLAPDGTLYDQGWRDVDWRHFYDVYVDPRDGILKRSLSDKRHRREAQRRQQQRIAQQASAETRVLGPMHELHRIDGVWYAIEFAPFPPRGYSAGAVERGLGVGKPSTPQESAYDVLQRMTVTSGHRYAARKRQLTRRELRQHGVHNILD